MSNSAHRQSSTVSADSVRLAGGRCIHSDPYLHHCNQGGSGVGGGPAVAPTLQGQHLLTLPLQVASEMGDVCILLDAAYYNFD